MQLSLIDNVILIWESWENNATFILKGNVTYVLTKNENGWK